MYGSRSVHFALKVGLSEVGCLICLRPCCKYRSLFLYGIGKAEASLLATNSIPGIFFTLKSFQFRLRLPFLLSPPEMMLRILPRFFIDESLFLSE